MPSVEALTGTKPVVLFAGDTIVGGKQNRVINVSVWLPAAKATPIPVSCLEAGRWNAGFRFESGRKLDYAFRAAMNQQVYERTRAERETEGDQPAANEAHRAPSYAADQGALWNEISARQARASVHSPTAALHDVYEREAVDLASLVGAFPCPAGASGLAVGIGGRLVALELFDSSATLAGQWPRLVEGAASAYVDHRRAVTSGWSRYRVIAIPTRAHWGGFSVGRRPRSAMPWSANRSGRGSTWTARREGPRSGPHRRRPSGPPGTLPR